MKRIIEIGICALILILPWQTRWIVGAEKIKGEMSEYLTYSLYASDVLLVGLLVLSLIYFKKRNLEFTRQSLWIALLIAVVGIVSLFVSDDKLLAFYFELRLLAAVGLFWLVSNFVQKPRLALYFIISLLAPAFLAIWQFLIQQTFANKWLGLAEHKASAGGTSVIETYANGLVSGRWLRAYGSFDHPNILGGVLAVGIAVAFYVLLGLNRGKKERIKRNFIYFCMVIFSLGVFVSFSRSAWIALLLGIATGGAVLFFQQKSADLKIWMWGAVVVVAAFGFMFSNYSELINVRVGGEVRLEKLSIDQRTLLWSQSKELLKDNPIFGVGIGNYVSTLICKNPEKPIWEYQPVHSTPMLILVELGILNVILLSVAIALLFWSCRKMNYELLVLLVALSPLMLFDHWLWSLHFGVLFFALVIGLGIGFYEKEKV